MKAGAVVISYDEDTEVYVNGQKILSTQNYIGNYEMHLGHGRARQALWSRNTIAVHTHQTVGGQHIDLALLCQ